MDDLEEFRTFYELADRVIHGASKEDVAEAARLLAMNVAHYQLKYGALPLVTVKRTPCADRAAAALHANGRITVGLEAGRLLEAARFGGNVGDRCRCSFCLGGETF